MIRATGLRTAPLPDVSTVSVLGLEERLTLEPTRASTLTLTLMEPLSGVNFNALDNKLRTTWAILCVSANIVKRR